LILQVRRQVKFLVVIDAKHAALSSRRSAHTTELRFEEACCHAGHDDKSGKAVVVRHARANGVSGDLRVVPGNREEDWRSTEDTEVVSAVRVLPEVFGIHAKIFA